jgi:hypothetical protein
MLEGSADSRLTANVLYNSHFGVAGEAVCKGLFLGGA